jgi:hypothetical protein
MAAHGFKTIHCEQAVVHPNFRTMTPVLHACFEIMEMVPANPVLPFDANTVQGLKLYVERSSSENEAVQPCLEKLASSGSPVIVWGAGCHTLRLLATSALGRANLTGIVDSNPLYQGKNVNGVPILKPDAIRGMDASILISSRVFQQSIQTQIQDTLHLENDIVTLYQLD